jgi:glyoxylate reductase
MQSIPNRPRVAVTRSSLPGGGLDRLRKRADVVLWPDDDIVPAAGEALREFAQDADAVLAAYAKVDRTFLEAVRGRVKVVALPSAGYDAVDVPAALDAGILVTNTPDVLHETTADTTFALMLLARRLLFPAAADLYSGRWKRSRLDEHLGLDVTGATLGLAGYGQIAQAVARRAAGFGMTVLHSLSRTGSTDLSSAVEWTELLERSDIVSLHVPLTAETKGLVGAPELARMKTTATLINTARGPVVDTAALLQALDDGDIHSAGLDVFDVEPIRDTEHPLLHHPRVAALPHVGSATEATRARMVDLAVDNILAVLDGRPPLTPIPEMKQDG